jgi:hypothetical protein
MLQIGHYYYRDFKSFWTFITIILRKWSDFEAFKGVYFLPNPLIKIRLSRTFFLKNC